MAELSLAAAAEQWANDLTYLSFQNKEIQRKCRGEKFVLVYRTIESRLVRTVYVLSLPAGMSCRRCGGREYWSYGDEPDLYRCARCFVRPVRASQRDVDYRLFEKHAENLIRRRYLFRQVESSLSPDEAGEPEKETVGGPTK
jgi:hypothetical protein